MDRQVEIPTDPDLNPDEIDETAIIPGPTMGLRVMLEIALSPQEESKKYFDAVINKKCVEPSK